MNVLIVRSDGIGDVILSIPVASQLRQLVPGVTVGFLTSPAVAPILDRHPDVDYVRTVRWTDSLSVLRAAFSGGVDAAVFLKPFRYLMWTAFVERVPIRVATGFRWYSLLANRHIYDHRSEFLKHESEYNVEMLRGLGLNPSGVNPPVLIVNEEERKEGDHQWSGLAGPRIVVHPGGRSARRWKPIHFLDLAVELARRGYGVALTGSDGEGIEFERDTLSNKTLPAGIRNLMGKLSVRELMGVIANAQVVVSGATGRLILQLLLALLWSACSTHGEIIYPRGGGRWAPDCCSDPMFPHVENASAMSAPIGIVWIDWLWSRS